MRFDEAFGILVEYCSQIGPKLGAAANDYAAEQARTSAYGNDIWIAEVVRKHYPTPGPDGLTRRHYLPFYDAAWELCRIGVLRPGPHASMGRSRQYGGGTYSADGFSITEFGREWLANSDRRLAGDPSRMSEILLSFESKYGPGFAQRAIEAVRCHRTGNYLAACAMSGAAAESILLAVAVAKARDEEKVLNEYTAAGGRARVTKLVVSGLKNSIVRQFDAALNVLHYWRDDAAHGMATTISEVEAYASLTQLLRLAQFCSDRWAELIA